MGINDFETIIETPSGTSTETPAEKPNGSESNEAALVQKEEQLRVEVGDLRENRDEVRRLINFLDDKKFGSEK